MPKTTPDYSCPSTQPDSEGARIFGVVQGSIEEPRVSYMEKGLSVSPATLTGLTEVSPTRIFRFAGNCVNHACAQFKNGGCRLGADIAEKMSAVMPTPPACSIRATCRWFAENGPPVCLRCPRVVTDVRVTDTLLSSIAAIASEPGSQTPSNRAP